MNNDDMFPKHEGGKNRLKALLQNLEMDQEQLTSDPRYKEGYDDGYTAGRLESQFEARCLIRALTKLYEDTHVD
jgi:hypothetical protein